VLWNYWRHFATPLHMVCSVTARDTQCISTLQCDWETPAICCLPCTYIAMPCTPARPIVPTPPLAHAVPAPPGDAARLARPPPLHHTSCLAYPKGRVNMPGIYYSHTWRGLVCWSCEAGAEAERAKARGQGALVIWGHKAQAYIHK
jgi:hypothetical protein